MSNTYLGEEIGTFTINSGKAIVSDPCYELETNGGKILDVFNGEWDAFTIENEEGRVKSLTVIHKDYNFYKYVHDGNYDLITNDLGVDSGQMAVCDYEKYDTSEKEYQKYCEKTLSELSAGIVGDYAAVSSTGYGDGSYELYGAKTDGKYYSFLIEFIPEYDEDYYEGGLVSYENRNFWRLA